MTSYSRISRTSRHRSLASQHNKDEYDPPSHGVDLIQCRDCRDTHAPSQFSILGYDKRTRFPFVFVTSAKFMQDLRI